MNYLNVDWFQPFTRSQYSVGVMYITTLNHPREERYKPQNALVVGIIPAPHEPKSVINSYLFPLVQELLELLKGFVLKWMVRSK